MPLLDKRVEIQYENLSGRIAKTTAARVRQYAQFVNRERADVIGGLLEYAMGKDKEFQQWLKTRAASATAEPEQNGKGSAT